jgi:hypothetical protein
MRGQFAVTAIGLILLVGCESPASTAAGRPSSPISAPHSTGPGLSSFPSPASGAASTPGFPKLPNYTPPDITASPRVSAIFTTHESPLTQAEYKVNNAWQGPGPNPGEWLVVYAGESMTDRVPALVVYALPTDPNAPGQDPKLIGLYRDAKAIGPLQITAASGNDLKIDSVTADGAVVPQATFSITTGTFATS